VSDSTATDWQPTGASVSLPEDTTHIWARLQDLTELTWPTAAEQIERLALVSWLNPRFDGAVTDTAVLDFTSTLANLSLESGPEFLIPLYLDAEKAWTSLVSLSNSEAIPLARPDYIYEGNFDELDAWRKSREAAGMDWWHSVMQVLDRLFMNDTIFGSSVANDVQSDLLQELDHRTRSSILDAALSIGAHMYYGPLKYGNESSNNSRKLHILKAFALSVTAAKDVLVATDPGDTENYYAAANRLSFLWELLKGYTYASADAMNDIGFFLQRDPAAWEEAELALIEGRTAIRTAVENLGGGISFSSYTQLSTREIMMTPLEDLFETMSRVIEKAEREGVILR